MPVLSLACHLPHNTPNIPSRYNNEQTTKQTKAINNSYIYIYIYIYISCKCDTNRAGHFTLDAYASRPVACLMTVWGEKNHYLVIQLGLKIKWRKRITDAGHHSISSTSYPTYPLPLASHKRIYLLTRMYVGELCKCSEYFLSCYLNTAAVIKPSILSWCRQLDQVLPYDIC